MQNDMSFGNLDAIEDDGFDLLPVADFNFRAVDIELKDTNAGTGKYFSVQFEVIDGQYAGRKIFQSFNVKNPNPDAVRIGLKEIKQWIAATGENASGDLTLSRVYNLEGKLFVGKTGVEKDKTGQYDDKSVIKRFKPSVNQSRPMQGGQQQQAAQFQQQQQPQQQQPQYQQAQQQFQQQTTEYFQQGQNQPVQHTGNSGTMEQASVQAQQMGGTFQQTAAQNVNAGNGASTAGNQPMQQQQIPSGQPANGAPSHFEEPQQQQGDAPWA